MRRRLFSTLTIALVLSAASIAPSTYATVLSQDQIQSITAGCKTIQSGLKQLQAADRVLRVNLGQHYDSIARRLMAPLNSRIALNGLDGVNLAKTTVDFNAAFGVFQKNYSNYDTSLGSALALNCEKQPIDVYSAILTARDGRGTVYKDTLRLNSLASQFQQQFEEFVAAQQQTQAGQ